MVRRPTARNIAIGKLLRAGYSMADANKMYKSGKTGGSVRKTVKVGRKKKVGRKRRGGALIGDILGSAGSLAQKYLPW